MVLSDRAQKWLNTLKREPAVSTEELKVALERIECPAFESWLEFHEKFAGYVQPLGDDHAKWGLIHAQAQWMPDGGVDAEIDGEMWLISCADAHPSYQYILEDNGHFLGGPSERFDIQVERFALQWWFAHQGSIPERRFNIQNKKAIERITTTTTLVPEVSDQYYEYFLGEDILAEWDPEEKRWIEVFFYGDALS